MLLHPLYALAKIVSRRRIFLPLAGERVQRARTFPKPRLQICVSLHRILQSWDVGGAVGYQVRVGNEQLETVMLDVRRYSVFQLAYSTLYSSEQWLFFLKMVL